MGLEAFRLPPSSPCDVAAGGKAALQVHSMASRRECEGFAITGHSYYGLENPVNRLRENFAVVCGRCETDHCAGRLPDSKFVAAQWKGKPDERQDHHNRGSG